MGNRTNAKDGETEEIESLLQKCISNGSGQTNSPDERIGGTGAKVSIRCRRHKKRFIVPIEWTATCEWLCPKCYAKLTEAERQRYAPPKGFKPEVRPYKEESAETLEVEVEKLPHEEEESPRPLASEKKAESKGTGKETSEQPQQPSAGMGFALAGLLPRWRMICRKCNREMPVHRMWLDNTSKVLCPECYSGMNSFEIDMFHKMHPESEAEFFKAKNPVVPAFVPVRHSEESELGDWRPRSYGAETLIHGGRCSTNFIMGASDAELLAAVRAGKVSKIRAKIEFARRRNADRYSDLPEGETYRYCRG